MPLFPDEQNWLRATNIVQRWLRGWGLIHEIDPQTPEFKSLVRFIEEELRRDDERHDIMMRYAYENGVADATSKKRRRR
jgi:hypothetical protein